MGSLGVSQLGGTFSSWTQEEALVRFQLVTNEPQCISNEVCSQMAIALTKRQARQRPLLLFLVFCILLCGPIVRKASFSIGDNKVSNLKIIDPIQFPITKRNASQRCDVHDYLCIFPNWNACISFFESSCLRPFPKELDATVSEQVYNLLAGRWQYQEAAVLGRYAVPGAIPNSAIATPSNRAFPFSRVKIIVTHSPLTNLSEVRENYSTTLGKDIANLIEFSSFGDASDLMNDKEHAARVMFRKAINMSENEVKKSMLSTMNAIEVMEDLLQNRATEAVLMLEDDALPIIGARENLEAFLQDALHRDFDFAFLGTCFNFNAFSFPTKGKKISATTWIVPSTRCFNAVLMKRQGAEKVLSEGSVPQDYLPIDFMFNLYIALLNLTILWSEPPIFYEKSKAVSVLPC